MQLFCAVAIFVRFLAPSALEMIVFKSHQHQSLDIPILTSSGQWRIQGGGEWAIAPRQRNISGKKYLFAPSPPKKKLLKIVFKPKMAIKLLLTKPKMPKFPGPSAISLSTEMAIKLF